MSDNPGKPLLNKLPSRGDGLKSVGPSEPMEGEAPPSLTRGKSSGRGLVGEGGEPAAIGKTALTSVGSSGATTSSKGSTDRGSSGNLVGESRKSVRNRTDRPPSPPPKVGGGKLSEWASEAWKAHMVNGLDRQRATDATIAYETEVRRASHLLRPFRTTEPEVREVGVEFPE